MTIKSAQLTTGVKMRLLFLSPLYPPKSGGGAQYTELMARLISGLPDVREVIVITERHNEEARHAGDRSGVQIARVLAPFHSLPRRMFRRYITFIWQNIQLVKHILLWSLRQSEHTTSVAIIHGSFLIHPSTICVATRLAKCWSPGAVRFILDLRDRSAPIKRLRKLQHFDLIISCSRNITDKISAYWPSRPPLVEVPVPLEHKHISEGDIDSVLSRFNLKRKRYLLATNGIINQKGFPLIWAAWKALSERGHSLDLAIAGNIRDWESRYATEQPRGGRLVPLGALHNNIVRVLMAGAAAFVNPSRAEGLPRSCLESLSVRTPTLLPPQVPEFQDLDPRYIGETDDPEKLAKQLEWIIERGNPPPYDLSPHDPQRCLREYRLILAGLAQGAINMRIG